MLTVEPGILPKSINFSFHPSDFAREKLIYMTWIGHFYCTTDYLKNREYYPDNLLLYVRSGTLEVRYGNKNYLMQKGELLLMNCRRPHYYHAAGETEFVYVHFSGNTSHEVVDYLTDLNGGPVYQYECNARIGKELYDTAWAYEKQTVQNLIHTHFWINSLLEQVTDSVTAPVQTGTGVDEAVKYILEHVGENITLEQVAEIANFSPFYFSHLFKKQTGYAPSEYIQSTRLEKAEQLLIHTNMNVENIAYEVGYEHASSFVNAFKKKIGYSPRQYRIMQRNI